MTTAEGLAIGAAAAAKFVWIAPGEVPKAIDALVERVALEIQRDAKTRAPVDTGALQSSIAAGRIKADTNTVEWQVGTNILYAAAQEFGTSRGVPPHPYLGPALEAARVKYG